MYTKAPYLRQFNINFKVPAVTFRTRSRLVKKQLHETHFSRFDSRDGSY